MGKCKECIHYDEEDYCFDNCCGKNKFIKGKKELLNVRTYGEAEDRFIEGLNIDDEIVDKIEKGGI